MKTHTVSPLNPSFSVESDGKSGQSPIEDQLCAGRMYWDAITVNWFRLIDRSNLADLRVIGNYREHYGFGGAKHYDATVLERDGRTSAHREFPTRHEAQRWIESQASRSASYCTGCGMSKPLMDSARKIGVTWTKYAGACCQPGESNVLG